MSDYFAMERRMRIAQSVILVGAMALLAARAVALFLGPAAGWISIAVLSVMAVRAAHAQRAILPSGSWRVTAFSAPSLHAIFHDLVRDFGLSAAPSLFVVPTRQSIALTTGVQNHTVVLLSEGIIARLSPRELRAVIAHELAHIRNRDLPLFAIVAFLQRVTHAVSGALFLLVIVALPALLLGFGILPPASFLYLGFVPVVSALLQMALLRTRELQADATAASVTADPAALASALLRIDTQTRTPFGWLTAQLPRSRPVDPIEQLLRTHPPTEERVRRLVG